MDILTSKVRSDFKRARLQASISRMVREVLNQPTQLMDFEQIKQALHINIPVYRGVKTVRLDQINGSLNRHHEFDSAFRPLKSNSSERWQSVNRAYYQGVGLPAVALYQVGDVYFVVDGHHRVSVARNQGQLFIDAEVHEFRVKINFTPDSNINELEQICSNFV